jgi:hypothetical protein
MITEKIIRNQTTEFELSIVASAAELLKQAVSGEPKLVIRKNRSTEFKTH